MRTEKLYHENSYLVEFEAEVLDIIPYGDKFGVVLNRTAFYPEGGGQPYDTGRLNDVEVLEVIEKNGELLHITDRRPEAKTVMGRINWQRRFDHMQQHTGQHILSACFDKLMNGRTDSFHLGRDIVSIEINIDSFTEDDAAAIENMANSIIYSNLPVTARLVDPEELKLLPLRKQPKVTENIRIVEVKDTDFSPCAGTHVRATGEVGMIKIKHWEKVKGGIKFTFVCGYRALKDYGLLNSIARDIGEKLSARDFELSNAVAKLIADYKNVQKQLSAATQELLKQEAEKLLEETPSVNGVKIISKILEGKSMNDAKLLGQHLIQVPGTVALLVCSNETAQVLFTRSGDVGIDMNKVLKASAPIIDGKGGGNPQTAQGGGSRMDELEHFLKAAVEHVTKELLEKK